MYLSFIQLFLIFLIYSFAGYVMEVISCSLEFKKFVNRGFLVGPVCPIYGIGAILIWFLLHHYENDAVIVFILGMLLTSLVEYITSYILEKIFHNKWWDYSHRWDSINGRVCLGNSIMFGIAALVVIYFAHPAILTLLDWLPNIVQIMIGTILLLVFIVDCIYSMIIAFNLRHRIIIVEELKNEKVKSLSSLIEKRLRDNKKKLKLFPERLLKAFPDLKRSNYEEFEKMKEISSKEKNERKTKKKNKK